MASSSNLKILGKNVILLVGVPSIPTAIWYKNAQDEREKHALSVKHKVRIPNVQTVDDIMIDKCLPGDVVLFDRRCYKCAASPLAALSCTINKKALCNITSSMNYHRAVEAGNYDHVGVIVPGRNEFDPLEILEATPSGIVSRPLLTRIEMSQSRTITVLPMSIPTERNYRQEGEMSPQTRSARDRIDKELSRFRDLMVQTSIDKNYSHTHSLLAIIGAITYYLGLSGASPLPSSPQAWLAVSALQHVGIAEHITGKEATEAKVEDFLHNSNYQEKDVIHLRPGYKFLRPVTMRDSSTY